MEENMIFIKNKNLRYSCKILIKKLYNNRRILTVSWLCSKKKIGVGGVFKNKGKRKFMDILDLDVVFLV